MPDLPSWVLPSIIAQIPLVAVVVYGYSKGWVHSDAEVNRIKTDHVAEIKRRDLEHANQIADWKRLYEQERNDRLAANDRLAHAISTIKDVVSGIDELTREVIRGK